VQPGKPIRIALLGEVELFHFGESIEAVNLAIERRGPILGHGTAVVQHIDGCLSGSEWRQLSEKAVSGPTIAAVIGTSCSGGAITAAPVLAKKGILFVAATNTTPSLTSPGRHVPFFARTAYNAEIQAQAMAEFVRERLNLRTAATIDDRGSYNRPLAVRFATEFGRLGGRTVRRQTVRIGRTDLWPLLKRIQTVDPEFLYAPLFVVEGGLLAGQVRGMSGLLDTILGGADGMKTFDWLQSAGRAAEGFYISEADQEPQSPRFRRNLLDEYERRFFNGRLLDPWRRFVLASTFDATNIVLDSIEDVALEEDDRLYIPRIALRDRIYATREYPGLSGTLTCDDLGDCNHSTPVVIYQVRNGAFRKAWTWRPGG
jgi:branched-chain amino acid transport system substrate-binding protein